jgi:hypothetical protein
MPRIGRAPQHRLRLDAGIVQRVFGEAVRLVLTVQLFDVAAERGMSNPGLLHRGSLAL